MIASPEARATLDRTCIAGRDNWRDTWWSAAARTGILAIGNHSWDHLHPTLDHVAQRAQVKGGFAAVDVWTDADAQIRQAEGYIQRRTAGMASGLFAYPYGESNRYLVDEYFPHCQEQHRLRAAFRTGGEYVSSHTTRWNIPRFVCGEHWRSSDELRKILRGSLGN